MNRYDILLFDADGTLIDFDKAEFHALDTTFRRYSLAFDERINALYQRINRARWKAFERGEITKQYLTDTRFGALFDEMKRSGISAAYPDGVEFERAYQDNLGKFCFMLGDSVDVCRELSYTHSLYIITNGVAKTQHSRLDKCPLSPYVKGLFVSEDIGWQKPCFEYFDYVLSRIPRCYPSRVLVIGDSLSSDMLGANNAGIDCCWFNPSGQPNDTGARIDYEIRDLRELFDIV